MEDYTEFELMELMGLVGLATLRTENGKTICVECDKEILPSNQTYTVERGRVHPECIKFDNTVNLIPIGCESRAAWQQKK